MEQVEFPTTSGGSLEKYARYAFFLALAVLPLFIVPVVWFPFLMGKVFTYTALISVSLALLILSWVRAKRVSLPHGRYVALVALLPIAYALSSLFSIAPDLSVLGQGVEVDTLFFALSAFVTFFLALSLLSRTEHVRSLVSFLGVSFGLVLLYQLIQVFAGTALLGSPSTNLVGSWNDFATVALLAAVGSLTLLQSRKMGRRGTLIAAAFLVVSLFFLVVVNLNVSWGVLLAVSALLAVVAFLSGKKEASLPPPALSSQSLAIPVAASDAKDDVSLLRLALPIGVSVLSIVFFVWGSTLSSYLSGPLSIVEVEARPSLESTYEIGNAVYGDTWYRTAIGSGPNTFARQWVAHKPAGVNSSIFWNVDFGVGYGTVPTAFVTAGLLGGLVTLSLIIVFVSTGVRAWVRSRYQLDPYVTAALLGASSLLLLTFVFPLGRTALLIAVALAAAFLACGMPRGVTSISFAGFRTKALAFGVVVLALAVGVAGNVYSTKLFFSQLYLGKANVAAAAGNLAEAEAQVINSLRMHTSGPNSRFLVSLGIERLNTLATATEGTEEERTVAFQTALTTVINNGQITVARDPENYANWRTLAAVYEYLTPLQVQGAKEAALEFLGEASVRAPRDPSLRLRIARIHALTGDYDAFRSEIDTVFSLKPNYTDAALMLAQVEADRNNIQGAIEATAAAVQTAPQNPGLWFSLGLLAYTAGSMQDAAVAFEQAIIRAPSYANAKYFLGLSYYNLALTEQAIGLFEDLVQTNPDNAEVALILGNLKAGKEPFDGAQPPVTPNPEDRPTAPIEE